MSSTDIPTSVRPRTRRASGAFVGAAIALALGLGSGTAYAFWAGSGAGSGTAATVSPQAITVVAASGTPSSALSPGGTADLLLELVNPNSYPVTITGISQSAPAVSPDTACVTTGVTVPSRTDLSIPVAGGADVLVHIPAGTAMSADSDNGCQGVAFQIPVTVTVRR